MAGQPKPFTLHNLTAVRRREDLGPDGIADIISMNDLCEASILWNLKVRYDKQHIYVSLQPVSDHAFIDEQEAFDSKSSRG